ncbi:hypothetical protein GLO73106DRAFT_00013740 [Gloeocapsa sp. PCC 73106]|nr:hypothetical protein GLO73106DRAFT_00013740 [Gloeocapsa sp. PCC 73106]
MTILTLSTHASPFSLLPANPTHPTPEMIAFFERRTREHIERVHHCPDGVTGWL